MFIDYTYLLSIPNYLYGIKKKKFNSEGIIFSKDGCIKSNLVLEKNIVKELESQLIPILEKSKSINKKRLHKSNLLTKKNIDILKKSSTWKHIINIASYGLKRNAYLKQGSITYLDSPRKSLEYGNQRWHHDNKGNQVKCMILMSDNSKNGQVTSYITKSHKKLRLKYDPNSRYSDKQVEGFLKKGLKVDLYGKKGEIYFIHTNGAHRGNCRINSDPRTLISINFAPRYAREVKNELFY